jgi:glycosyltransferase involved in cell wall biosynthesis
MMRVLWLTQVLPYPPDSGPKVKTFNLIKYLARRCEITLVSFVRGHQSVEVKQLQGYCKAVYPVPMQRGIGHDSLSMVRSLLSGQPWLMLRDHRTAMRRRLDWLATQEQFEVVHADQLNMCQYAVHMPGSFKLFDAHNALWLLYRRLAATMSPGPKKWLLQRDWRLLKAYEGRVCRAFDAVTAVSPVDKAALVEASGEEGSPIQVVPITVDTDEVSRLVRHPHADHVVHVGTMYWPPNIDGVQWFAHHVWPLIRARRPATVFDVIGARPPRRVLALSTPRNGIKVTGYVEALDPYLAHTGVFIVPLRAGGGMRVKILHALAQGLPIVSTRLGCEGIQVTPGHDILIADTPAEFAEAVLRVLRDPDLAAHLSENARRLAETVYDYRIANRPLEAIYQQASLKSGENTKAKRAPPFDQLSFLKRV